jgi:amino acid permease
LQALNRIFGDTNPWYYAIGIIVVYSPLAWVRKLQYFSFGYVIGNVMILVTVSVISYYSLDLLIKNGPKTEEFYAVNTVKEWDMIGFSFYCFEGIGAVLPIMEQTKDK